MPKVNDTVLIGEKQLRKILATLPGKVRRKVLRQALNAAGTPILKEARARANESKESGTLKKSLKKKVKVFPSGTGVVMIGPDKETSGEFNGKKRIPRYYAHLVENGHIDASGKFVPGKPFLRPAFDSKSGESLNVLKQKLADGVVREAAK
jgi:HK97 gp10 family phage protein